MEGESEVDDAVVENVVNMTEDDIEDETKTGHAESEVLTEDSPTMTTPFSQIPPLYCCRPARTRPACV